METPATAGLGIATYPQTLECLPEPQRRPQHLGKGGLAAWVQIEDRLVRLSEIGQPRPPGMELYTALIRQPEQPSGIVDEGERDHLCRRFRAVADAAQPGWSMLW